MSEPTGRGRTRAVKRRKALAVVAAPVLAAGALAICLTTPAHGAAGATKASLAASSTVSTPTSHYLPGTACRVFPTSNYWHADISKLPVNKYSANWLAHMSAASRHIHADFGPSYGAQPVPYGIPVTVVHGASRVPVTFEYASESDRILYPLSSSTLIEGGAGSSGDRHAIVVDANNCELFETWNTQLTSSGWTAGSGAAWNLNANGLRPLGWTSADAAGLPILPGLLRYDEILAGHVDHAIRFTTNVTDEAFVWPARHEAGSLKSVYYPPMGARFRLKASYNITGYSRDARVVLQAMKTYGLVLADNGSPWYFQGTADTRWPASLISDLAKVPATAFEAVNTAPLEISVNSAQAR